MHRSRCVASVAAVVATTALSSCAQVEPDPNVVVQLSESKLPPGQPNSLTGTSWRLLGDQSYESKIGFQATAPQEIHTVRFKADGSAELLLACNSGNARWQASERKAGRGNLGLDDISVEDKACPGTNIQRLPQALGMIATYAITADGELRLHLKADSGFLVWKRIG